MTNDLIERYIYAVVKKLPNKLKNDISEELRTIIDDMLTERCKDIPPSDKDIKIVLMELGTPDELYEKYSPDSQKCLIGSPYYSTYKYILKIVLICTGIGLTISSLISGIIDIFNTDGINPTSNLQSWTNIFVNLFATLYNGLLAAFAFVTLLFAFFYRKNIKLNSSYNPDNLPPVPQKTKSISKADPIIGICFSIIFLIVFLITPQILCIFVTDINKIVPIFNSENIRSAWYILILFSAAGIIREVIILFEREYNKKVMISSIACNAASAVFALCWLLRDNIINKDFLNNITSIFDKSETFIITIFSNFQYFFLGVILFALILDTAVTIFKTLRN